MSTCPEKKHHRGHGGHGGKEDHQSSIINHQFQLRLFDGTTDADAPLTLCGFFETFVLPSALRGAAVRHVAEHRQSLGYWRKFTGDPPLDQVDQETCRRFLDALEKLPGRKKGSRLGVNTVRKHCRHLQFCLDRAGPAGKGNREGQGLIEAAPWLKPPRAVIEAPRQNYSLDEIRRWLEVCRYATTPKWTGDHHGATEDTEGRRRKKEGEGLSAISDQPSASTSSVSSVPSVVFPSAGDWWRALVTVIYNTGLRIGSALALEWEMLDVEGEGLSAISDQPSASSSSVPSVPSVAAPSVWLVLPVATLKGRRGQRVFCNDAVREALGVMRGDHQSSIINHQSLIFPWPHGKSALHAQQRRLCQRAGIRELGFHGLRRATATELSRADPHAAQLALGHSAMKTTKDHYINPEIAAAALAQLPQPGPIEADPQRLFW